MGKLMRYLVAAVLALAMASAGICATDVWKVGTVHGLFQYEISEDGSELLFFEQPRNDNNWFWWNNNGSPYGTLATGGFGPNGYRDGSRTFAMSRAAAGQKLKDLKLKYTYYNPWGGTTMNFFITDGRGRYGIFAPTSLGIGAFAQETVNGQWTTITVDLTNTSIPDSTSVAVYEHNGLKAVYGEPFTTFTWGEIKDYTIAGMYDYQRSPHYGWGAWAEVFGQLNSSWTPFAIRNATTSGNPPAINDVVEGGVLAKEFVIAEGGQKAAWGTRMLDGKKVKDIEGHILRLDDYTRFAAGSGPRVAPYFNIWVTDGNGKFAVIGNEPSNPEWTTNFGSQWNFDWDMLKTKVAKAYENTDKSWLPKNGVGMVFNDLAEYTILPPTPAQLSAGWPGLGGGAPRELGTNKAYGFNWVFGDTLSNYVTGDPGYVVAQPDIRKDAPALVNGYGVALIWGDTVGNTTYATQKRLIKEPVITFGDTDYEGEFEDSSVPNLLFLTPETVYAKPSTPVVLGLYQANLQTPVAGYQAFLGFDTDMLGISAGNITLTPTPYVLQLMKAVASGEVDLAAGVNYGDPGTTVDAQLATLTFTAGTTEGVTSVTFRDTDPPTRFTDDEGNEVRTAAVESGDIVIDGTPPVITCPGDKNQSNDAGKCGASVDVGQATAEDALAGVDTIVGVRDDTLPLDDDYPVGVTTITWTATDKAGNSAQCVQTITVTDDEDPTITAPGDVAVNNDAGYCYATGVALGTPVTDDNCGVASVTNNAPAQFPVGETIVTWTVYDVNGNSATDTQKVTVTDSEDPSIICPPDLVVSNDTGVCSWTPGAVFETFDSQPDLNVWTVDRKAPAAFESVSFDGGNRLHIGIAASDWQTSGFYNTQGRSRAFSPPCVTKISGELYIPAAWENQKRRSDIWGVTRDAWGSISGYPILGFANVDGATPVLRVFSQDTDEDPSNGYQAGWRNLGLAITYDKWYKLDIVIADDKFEFYVDDVLALTDSGTFGSLSFSAMMLQGYNFAEDYDIYWDNVQAGPLMDIPTVDDNCDIAGLTYVRSDGKPLGDAYPVGETTITWTVTDIHGNSAYCGQKVTVNDDEDPVITCPGNIQVYALPGSSEASVDDPGTAGATDNCGVQSVVGTRSDSKSLDYPYPVGVTTITWVATDTSDNTAQCQQTITVLNKNEAEITVELESVSVASLTREIEFQFGGDGSGTNTATVYANVVFTNGTGTVTVEVPAGVAWTCVTAKDRQHTLRSQTTLGVAGGKYTASFTGDDKLIGGDLTNDNLVDILDFGVFAGQYGTAYPGYRAWPNRDADISGDGQVETADFTYIQTHFLNRGKALCGGAPDAAAGLADPKSSIRLRDLSRIIGAQAAYAADVNKDGIIDLRDVELFVQRNIAGAR